MRVIYLQLVLLLSIQSSALACSVCYGNPEAAETMGLQAGIMVLLGVTGFVLLSFSFFFLNLRNRSQSFAAINNPVKIPEKNLAQSVFKDTEINH